MEKIRPTYYPYQLKANEVVDEMLPSLSLIAMLKARYE